MHERINQLVSVLSGFDAIPKSTVPYKVRWNGQEYRVKEIGFVHSYREGRKLVHVFEVNVGSLDMRLHLDSETLHWTLAAVSDGLAD